jgi:hypothetical protein
MSKEARAEGRRERFLRACRASRRAWTRHLPGRLRLPVAAALLAAPIIMLVVVPVYFGGYLEGGTVHGTSIGAWDVGYAHTNVFASPADLLAAAPWSPATTTMLRPNFRVRRTKPPPGAPAAAFDAYILTLTYLPRYEATAGAASPMTSVQLGLALYAFGAYNNGSRLAACCGFDGLSLQFNGVDLPVMPKRAIPWLAVQDMLLVPTSPRSSLEFYPFDSYIGHASIDMAFTLAGGEVEPFTETHVPWGVVATAPPTSLDVGVRLVLEPDVPVPYITVRLLLRRTLFTKVMSVVREETFFFFF